MAMSGRVIPEFASVSGYLPSTIDQMLRALRAAGLAPMGEHGRGKKHGQYQLDHLANVIMAFGGALPSDAASAVKILRGLRESPGNPLFGEQVEVAIRCAAAVLNADSEIRAHDIPFLLTMSLHPPLASIRWHREGVESVTYYYFYGHPGKFRGAVTRSTIVHTNLFLKAAELWLDTLRQAGVTSIPPLSSQPTKADEAPPSPAPASPDQPAPQRTSTLNTSKDTLTHRGASTIEAQTDRVPSTRKG